MNDWILQLNSVWVWVLLAVVLVILFVLVVLSTVVRRGRSAPMSPVPAPAPAPGAPMVARPAEPEEPGATGVPESASASFSRAMRFLRSTVSGRDYRYQIPWYLVLGDRASGKSALMRSIGINLAASETGSGSPLKWRFLDSGILIGVSGRYHRANGREGHDWNHLLSLLQNNRPRRPLDGIVLTVAASDLIGPAALDENLLSARAARFGEMLTQAQRTLGFVFPVYVVVTKCDEIEGFSAFCRELPSRSRDDIFGWSSPYQLDAAFAPEWVDEAFNGVAADLQRLQSEILVERSELRDPDAVFLFPEEFARMRPTLGIYLERLFRETAYREAFRFRGLYFSGDITEPAAPEPAPEEGAENLPIEYQVPEIAPAVARQAAIQLPKSPCFAKRLFDDKIFAERGLARPLARVFLTRSRTVTYIQAAAAVLALILFTGTWFSYRRLTGDRDRIVPPLDRMTSSLKANTPEEAKTFGLGLLNSLDLASNVRFFSVFQPASWFSPLDDNVTLVMKVACEQWVFAAFQAELVQRKNKLLYGQGGAQIVPAVATSASPQAAATTGGDDPQVVTGSLDSVPEYQVLLRFVNELASLSDAVSTYEDLRQQGQTPTPDRIRHLLGYIGLADVRATGHLAAALVSASGPSAAFSPADIGTASDSIRKLVDDVLKDWFDNNQAWDDVGRLQQAIGALQRGQASSYDKLQELVSLINQVQSDFTDPNFRWLGNTGMELPPTLKRVCINPLSSAQNAELAAYANNLGSGYFVSLRDNLREARTSLTGGPLLDLKNPIDLSAGTKQLQMSVDNLLNLPFMSGATDLSGVHDTDTIQVALRSNQRLIWRLDPVLEAQKQTKFYTDFLSNGMGSAPQTTPALVGTLGPIALNQVARTVKISIAKAETFQPRTTGPGGLGSDDETLEEVNAFREAIGPLSQLAEQYQGFGKTDIHNAVMQITIKQAYALLSTLDDRLTREQPYAMKLGAWNGAGSLSFAVFGVNSAPALQVYLGAQRERVKYFEQQSEAIVPFLDRYMPVQAVEQKQLITKWQGIISDFQQYANKGTNSTLMALEDYVTTGIDKLPLSACKAGAAEAGTDYFVQIRNHMATQLANRCGDVTANGVCTAYAGLASQFNMRLAGKYPFAPAGTAVKAEAEPAEITSFYKALDASGQQAEAALKASLGVEERYGDDGRKARQFLEEMDDLRIVAVPTGDNAKEPPFTVDVVPQFRVNQTREIGGNQVIDWTMQVVGQIFQLKDPEHPGRWRPANPESNPVRLSLRWANDSFFVPSGESSQPDLVIRGRNAYFEFTDRWALLRFLQRHEAPSGDLGPTADTTPYTLKFRVNTVPDPKWTMPAGQQPAGPATVFLHMKVMPAGQKTPIRIPPIPAFAPPLTTGCGTI
jgi:type VI secretion system protein ImpL